ncbi:hypothetical protein BU14_0053s0021 [Porphyra umbilicalis]|uniref:Uncharacterized protein n=1 Tax=Porphyra umbilicalis TaxID=2786 RepID=A0A1X6PHQ3_PORUM|nr:hypothetical protein BU14_0053s0021 [Porphyra umbilicalis]|eukprot:OSX80357.1 hypothetical protein BU14_0053s0021 [Porphyra umbilicalis]
MAPLSRGGRVVARIAALGAFNLSVLAVYLQVVERSKQRGGSFEKDGYEFWDAWRRLPKHLREGEAGGGGRRPRPPAAAAWRRRVRQMRLYRRALVAERVRRRHPPTSRREVTGGAASRLRGAPFGSYGGAAVGQWWLRPAGGTAAKR